MSNQDGTQATAVQRPANDDKKAWEEYWKAQGQEWRIMPEIDAKRQAYLDEKRSVKPNSFLLGILPFKNVELNRADVEWLLATHENGRGPIDWRDKSQFNRKGLDLRGADLRGADLDLLPMANVVLDWAHLEGASLHGIDLERGVFFGAHLERAWLDQSILCGARLEGAHLEGANLAEAFLAGANLSKAFFDSETELNGAVLSNEEYGGVFLVDIHWNDVNLAVVDWSLIKVLGDERSEELSRDKFRMFKEHQTDVRAYRQLSVVLRNQGLSEDAARFAYRAQLMQRKVFWYQRKIWQYLGSLFLDLLTGYGYKPIRSFLAYLIVITTFATAYFIIGRTVGPALTPLGSLVFSMTSFHGRGFFPGGIKLDDPLTVLAAFEAFIGLIIEVTFIATLTQRLFGK